MSRSNLNVVILANFLKSRSSACQYENSVSKQFNATKISLHLYFQLISHFIFSVHYSALPTVIRHVRVGECKTVKVSVRGKPRSAAFVFKQVRSACIGSTARANKQVRRVHKSCDAKFILYI